MRTLISVFKDILSYINPSTKRGRIGLIISVILIVGFVLISGHSNDTDAEETVAPRLVRVASAGAYTGATTANLVGTVAAVDEADIKSEAGGRVVRVPVAIGDTVRAGAVIAQLENQSQYAAVLQAEGAYESALAAAAQTGVGLEEAETAVANANKSARTTYASAFTTVQNSTYTTIDQFFANPTSNLPGLRLDGGSNTQTISNARIALQSSLNNWDNARAMVSSADDVTPYLRDARTITDDTIALVDMFIERLNDTDEQERFTEAELRNFVNEFSSVRASLTSTVAALEASENAIVSSNDSLRKARINAESSGTTVSAADAQVKSALGSLRAAQAAYAKTIIRTPISGEITALTVDEGDFITIQSPVAVITNSNALEITTFIGESERSQFVVGNEVLIDGTYSGRVSAVSGALNPTTKKIEVKIQTDATEIVSGDTVRISLTSTPAADTEVVDQSAPILVPITAVKFTTTAGSVFTVVDERLVAVPVELGAVQGNYIVVESGIDRATEFVIDARGLSAGTHVEVMTE